MIQKATDTRQQQVNARREWANECFERLGEALNTLPDYVFVNYYRVDHDGQPCFDVSPDSFERLFAGRTVRLRRDYGWIEGEIDGVRFYASGPRYRSQPQRDETITLPEVVS